MSFFLLFGKLYFSSAFNYSNPKFLLCIQHFTFDFQVVSATRFFKNASRTEVVRGWKNISHVQSWDGAPSKMDPLTVKKK